MLLNINYTGTYRSDHYRYIYFYELIDSKYIKKFDVVVPFSFTLDQVSTSIIDYILNFIYDEYKYTSECPFINIQKYVAPSPNYNNDIILTNFYLKHKKMMDKILEVNIRPAIIENIDISFARNLYLNRANVGRGL